MGNTPSTSTDHASSSSLSHSTYAAIPPFSIAALPSLPSTESGIRILTQTITQPSTTFTTTVIFTPNPEQPQTPNKNNNLHPTPSSETVLSAPDVIAVIVLVSVAGTALLYIIYRVYVAQRMNPATASWCRDWGKEMGSSGEGGAGRGKGKGGEGQVGRITLSRGHTRGGGACQTGAGGAFETGAGGGCETGAGAS